VEAARRAQEEAERRAAEAAAREEARVRQEVEALEQLRQAEAKAKEAKQQRRDAFVAALAKILATMDPGTAAAAIADGELHPAVQVDWSRI
jgi:colicin import membrane protein